MEYRRKKDTIVIYNDKGNKVLLLKFNIIETEEKLFKKMEKMADQIVKKNNIIFNRHCIFIELITKENKRVLYTTGKTPKNNFFKLWIIAKEFKIISVIYESAKKTIELKKIDKIINSFCFLI